MKKIYLLLLLAFVCSTQAFSQFQMGVRIGANFSMPYGISADGATRTLFVDAPPSYKMKAGVKAGLTFNYQFTDVISIEPAVYYSLQRWGNTASFSFTDTLKMTTEETIQMQLIQIPVMVNFSIPFGQKPNHAVVLGVGPYFSVAVSGKEMLDGHLYNQYNGQYLDIRGTADLYKNEQISFYAAQIDDHWHTYDTPFDSQPYCRCDFGFSFAAGLQLGKFYVGAGCDLGVINTAKSEEWAEAGVKNYKQHNLNIDVMIGFNF